MNFNHQRFYDQVILPRLLEVKALCAEHGLSLVAGVTFTQKIAPCSCGDADCKNKEMEAFDGWTIDVAAERSSPVLIAVAMLTQLPPHIQREFVEAIVLAKHAVERGGNVQIRGEVRSAGDEAARRARVLKQRRAARN